MKLLLSSLLLASLRAVPSRSVSSTPVTQSPDVSVMEGETVNITCCWTTEFVRMRIIWLKNQTKMTEIFNFMNHSKGDSLQQETSHCSDLTFTNVTREDSGRYTCRVVVEIPLFNMVEGNGTVITVTARDKTTDNTAGGVSSTPDVKQSPDVPVMEGETVTITCCWTLDRVSERGRLVWLKNQTTMKTEIFNLMNLSKEDSLQQETSHCSNLTFTNVTIEDSGRYTCRVVVEIPLFNMVEGNGTVITVTARDKTTDNTAGDSHSKKVLIFVLRCLPIVALVITFFSINYLAKKAQQRAQATGRSEENQEEEEGDETEI